jgi:uncharacterized OB-fold protein
MPTPDRIASFSKYRVGTNKVYCIRVVAGCAPGDGELLIEHCAGCGRWLHPPVGSCPDCGGRLVAEPVSGHATVFTYTVNVQPYNPEIPTPYVIAIVELAEQQGLRLATNIVDCEPDSVFCGMEVQAAWDRRLSDGDAASVPVFAPAAGSGGAPGGFPCGAPGGGATVEG